MQKWKWPRAECSGCTAWAMCAFCWTGIRKLFTSIFLSAAYVVPRYINILINRPVLTIHHIESRVISQVILLATVLICFVHARIVPFFGRFINPFWECVLHFIIKLWDSLRLWKFIAYHKKLSILQCGCEKSSQTRVHSKDG